MSADAPATPENLELVRVRVDYTSEYASIPVVREQFKAFLGQIEVDPDGETGFDLLAALTESISNVIRHAHDQDGRAAHVDFEYDGKTLRIEVYDSAPTRGFDPATSGTTVPDLESEGGRGLFLMQSLTDDIALERTTSPTGKMIRLTKRLD